MVTKCPNGGSAEEEEEEEEEMETVVSMTTRIRFGISILQLASYSRSTQHAKHSNVSQNYFELG
jgi:hypothetical protein